MQDASRGPQIDAIKDQRRVVDEQERQGDGAHRIEERGKAGLNRIATRHSCRGKAGKAHRWRHVGHDAEVEHEQVGRDQGHDQPFLCAQLHDHARHQRRHNDVVCGGRQAHAKDQREQTHQQQHDEKMPAG